MRNKEIKGKLVNYTTGLKYGNIGTETPLVDINGNKLYVGDLVYIDSWVNSIVCTSEGNIMGLFRTTQKNIKDYKVKKIKSYEELRDNEIYECVKVVLDKEDAKLENKGDKNNMNKTTLEKQLKDLQIQVAKVESKIKQREINNNIDEKIITYNIKRTEIVTGEQHIGKDKIAFKLDDITKQVEYEATYTRKGNKVICKFMNIYNSAIVGKGIATCCEEDEFDYYKGVTLSELRARSDFYKKVAKTYSKSIY